MALITDSGIVRNCTMRVRIKKCICRGCTSCQINNPELRFFKFPTENGEKRNAWFKFADCDPNYPHTKQYLCALHFADNDFTSTLKTRLLRFAVPTINGPPPREDNGEETQDNLSDSELYSGSQLDTVQDTSNGSSKQRDNALRRRSSNEECSEVGAVVDDQNEDNSSGLQIKEEPTDLEPSQGEGRKYSELATMLPFDRSKHSEKQIMNNIKSMCRLCFSENVKMYPIFYSENKKEFSLEEEHHFNVMKCIPVPLKREEKLPDQICDTCYQHLLSWYNFSEMCSCTQTILKQFVNNIEDDDTVDKGSNLEEQSEDVTLNLLSADAEEDRSGKTIKQEDTEGHFVIAGNNVVSLPKTSKKRKTCTPPSYLNVRELVPSPEDRDLSMPILSNSNDDSSVASNQDLKLLKAVPQHKRLKRPERDSCGEQDRYIIANSDIVKDSVNSKIKVRKDKKLKHVMHYVNS